MNAKTSRSTAEFAETFLRNMAFAVLLVALSYATEATIYLVDESVGNILSNVSFVLAMLVLILIMPQLAFKLFRLSTSQRKACFHAEGYVLHVFRRACAKAFEWTFVLLIVMDFITERQLLDLPGNFFFKVTVAISLGIFAITFFVLNHLDDDDTSEEAPLA